MSERRLEADPVGFVLAAVAFAADKHTRQRRKNAEESPYINHPIAVASVLWREARISDPIVIVGAILHDTVEDTDTSLEEIADHFGDTVSAIVAEVSDDKSLPSAERKRLQIEHAPKASFRAQQVKLADKICNLRDIAVSPPAGWSVERCRTYFDWSRAVVEGLRAEHPALAELFDVAYAGRP